MPVRKHVAIAAKRKLSELKNDRREFESFSGSNFQLSPTNQQLVHEWPPYSPYCELRISRSWRNSSGKWRPVLLLSRERQGQANQSSSVRCNFCWVSVLTNR